MPAAELKVYQTDLESRPATQEEQEVLDVRTEEIGKGERKDEDLFDKREEVKEPEAKAKDEGEPEKESDKEGQLQEKELLEAKDEDLNDDQKVKKAELVKAKEIVEAQEENDRIEKADDKDLSKEELVKKKELVKAKEGSTTVEKQKEAFEADVKAYVTEHKVSEEEARKDVESISKIVDNSKGDAKVLGKNYLHLQRMAAKTHEELKAIKDAPPVKEATLKTVAESIEAGEITLKGKPATRDQIIDAYRVGNPDVTEGVDEEIVFKMVCKDIKHKLESNQAAGNAEFIVKAKEKKDKLLGELSEDEQKFLPALEPLLDELSPSQIMGDKFDLGDMILWAKGKTYDDAIKEADARGFKRGVEKREILGAIDKPGEGSPKTKKGGVKGAGSLNAEQRKEAEEMFASNDVPLEEKYELYAEIVEHDKDLTEKEKNKDKK